MITFKKDIESKQGVISQNQVVTEIRVKLYRDGQNPNEVFPQPAFIEIGFYANKDAIVNGKTKLQTTSFTIEDISKIASYPVLVQEVVNILLTDEKSPVYQAQLEDTTI